jgi:hypothetical protein
VGSLALNQCCAAALASSIGIRVRCGQGAAFGPVRNKFTFAAGLIIRSCLARGLEVPRRDFFRLHAGEVKGDLQPAGSPPACEAPPPPAATYNGSNTLTQ